MPLFDFLYFWQDVFFAMLAAAALFIIIFFAQKKIKQIPGRLQAVLESFVSYADELMQAVAGPRGRKYLPFVGTLFIYVAVLNLIGVLPLCKSPTANLSTTIALSLCVFFYVQYAGFKELGVKLYAWHFFGKMPRFIMLTFIIPVFILFIHIISEVLRPFTLALRLRSNIWGDELLFSTFAQLGLKGVPLFLFSSLLVIVGALAQAAVFAILTMVYFALVLGETEEKREV